MPAACMCCWQAHGQRAALCSHPRADEDWEALKPLRLGAVVTYDMPLRLRPRVLEGPCEWARSAAPLRAFPAVPCRVCACAGALPHSSDRPHAPLPTPACAAAFSDVWLHDRLLMLCHLSAAPLMREALSHLASMQAAMAGLRAITTSQAEEEAGRMLADTRRQCQAEFVRSLRAHEWAQCWLLSPWRQQAAFVLAVSTALLVSQVAEQRGGLLRYVPELYCSTILDMVRWWGVGSGGGLLGWARARQLRCLPCAPPLPGRSAPRQVHAVHRCEPPVLDHGAMLGLGLRHILDLVVGHLLEDERIVSPEVNRKSVCV